MRDACQTTWMPALLSSYNSYCKFINWLFDLYALDFAVGIFKSLSLNLINSEALIKSNSGAARMKG